MILRQSWSGELPPDAPCSRHWPGHDEERQFENNPVRDRAVQVITSAVEAAKGSPDEITVAPKRFAFALVWVITTCRHGRGS